MARHEAYAWHRHTRRCPSPDEPVPNASEMGGDRATFADLDPATDKYHLVGVGCASAVPLFRLALGCLRDWPERQALVVAAESISGFLTGATPGDDKVKVVGSALFGDGCAAALLEDGDDEQAPGPRIVATAVYQVPETLDYVRFRVTDDDSHMDISRELPALAESSAAGLVKSFLGERHLTMADIEHWLVHPGDRGIVEALQRALGLTDEQVAPSVGVLRRTLAASACWFGPLSGYSIPRVLCRGFITRVR